MNGLTLRRFVRFLRHACSNEPLTDEILEHWSSFPRLLSEAQGGCHLCSLVLATLSSEQRDELCQRDAELKAQLRGVEEGVGAADQDLTLSLRAHRTVYFKVIAPSAFEWRSDRYTNYGRSSLLLVPHFGWGRLPRRWLSQRHIERANSLNLDPTIDWKFEYVDPIEIRRAGKLQCLYRQLGNQQRLESKNDGPISLGLGQSTNSSASVDFIKAWLRKHCHADKDFPFSYHDSPEAITRVGDTRTATTTEHQQRVKSLPSRLIDLSQWDDTAQSIRVIHKADLDAGQICYAALSYCWRKDETNMLTGGWKQPAISASHLAPTIRDAIQITHRLGYRYLWVDALCIVQDSDTDKQNELPKMVDIYSNADFVVAAVAAADSSESLFVEQNPLRHNPCVIGVSGQHQALSRNKLNSFGGIYALPSRKYATDSLDDLKYSRLASRGWVFQEARLARRTLYFTGHQIILQCNLCRTRENQLDWETVVSWSDTSYPDLVRPDVFFAFYKLLFFVWILPFWYHVILPCFTFRPSGENTDTTAKASSKTSFFGRLTVRRFLRFLEKPRDTVADDARLSFAALLSRPANELQTEVWWQLVEAYTQCFLSESSDRLPAIEGLAMRMQRELRSRDMGLPRPMYFQGIFDSPEALVPSLLWYVSDPRTVRPRYRAPTWSWASVDGGIKNNSAMCSADQWKSGVIVTRLALTSGRLRIYAKLRPAAWRPIPNEPRRYYVGHHQSLGIESEGYHNQFAPVVSNPTSGPEVHALCEQNGEQVGHFIPDTDEYSRDVPAGSPLREIYCLRIIARPRDYGGETDFAIPWATRGLALAKLSSGDNVYSRIGYIELSQVYQGMEFSRTWPDRGRNRRKRDFPEIDDQGFFAQWEGQTIHIV